MKNLFAIIWALPMVLLCHNPSFAGWISEVQPQPRDINHITQTVIVTLPALLEASGLASLDQAEIVIINASSSPTRHGRILQVIPIGTGGDVRLIQDSSLDLNGPRSLLLFNGTTGLVTNSGTIPSLNDLNQTLTAQLLDVVTYGPAESTSAWGEEPVLEWASGQVIARPMLTEAQPWEHQYIVGTPNINGFITNANPSFRLNPGLANSIWQPLHMPSPNTAALLMVMVFVTWPWRQTNPSHA